MSYSLQGYLNIIEVTSSPYSVSSNTPLGTVYVIDASSAKTINLPAISSVKKGTRYIFKRDGGGVNITIDGNSSETIDGSATKNISGTWDSWCVISDGSQWLTIGYGAS